MQSNNDVGEKSSKLVRSIQFLVGLIFLFIIIFVFFTDVLPPRILFSPFFVAAILFLSIIIVIFLNRCVPKLLNRLRLNEKIDLLYKWPLKRKIVAILLFIVFLGLLVSINPIIDKVSESKYLDKAKLQFNAIIYPNVTEKDVNTTLVELYKPLVKMREIYVENPPSYLINVHLFSNRAQYVKLTGQSDISVGGTYFEAGSPPIIALPVEPASGYTNDSIRTTTPTHEIIHVICFEAINQKDIGLVDRFFLEGVAEYKSKEGLNHFADRVYARVEILFLKKQLDNLKDVPNIDVRDKNTIKNDCLLFYDLAGEFLRYLSNKYGDEKCWQTLSLIGNDFSFEESFLKTYNNSFTDEYSDFLGYYF